MFKPLCQPIDWSKRHLLWLFHLCKRLPSLICLFGYHVFYFPSGLFYVTDTRLLNLPLGPPVHPSHFFFRFFAPAHLSVTEGESPCSYCLGIHNPAHLAHIMTRPGIQHLPASTFWAAAPKRRMTYAFTQGKFSFSSVRLPPLKLISYP